MWYKNLLQIQKIKKDLILRGAAEKLFKEKVFRFWIHLTTLGTKKIVRIFNII